MTAFNNFRKLTQPGWRLEAIGIMAIVCYFIVVIYTEGGMLDAPLFVQLNMLLAICLASCMTATMIRYFRKGKDGGNRDYFMMSALLAAIHGLYFALNGAAFIAILDTTPKELIILLGNIYQYGYFAFALYAFYCVGRR